MLTCSSTIPQLSEEYIYGTYADRNVPWGPVGYIVFKRTYARKIGDRTEEWYETVGRCVNSVLKIAKGAITEEEGMKLFDYVFNLKACFSGRGLWQLGTPSIEKFGGASLVNCWFVSMNTLDAFPFLFDMLMLGGGVGFNIQREHIYKLPPVKKGQVFVTRQDTKDADFIVPDTREGWVELLRRTLDAFFVTGKGFSFSTICIRGAGTPISGFGGVASGPDALCRGLDLICALLRNRAGKQLRSIDVLDICNLIGAIVVAGNVRRSAEIALGDPDDFNFLRAKNWSTGNIPNSRAMSNNTVVANAYDQINVEFWNSYKPNTGEPYGLFNRDLARSKGRLKDLHRIDPAVVGLNPCGEICLNDWEPCNLAEIYLPNIESQEEFNEIATLLYKVCKTITTLPYHWPQSNSVVKQNRRIGIGIDGYLQAPQFTTAEALDTAYKAIEAADVSFSKTLSEALGERVGPSIKLTTIKPSGTLSLLAGVSPGIHPEYAPFYIRRIRMSSTDPLLKSCREAGHKVEPVLNLDGTYNHDTSVVEFPIKARPNSVLAKDLTAIQMLETVKHAQTYWADNAVSCTVYYEEQEIPQIQEWLKKNYENSVKSVSFLLKKNHGFLQAPLEEITEKQFNDMKSKIRPMFDTVDVGYGSIDSQECAGGSCPIK